MGLNYKLSNGEYIEIDIETTEEYEKKILIKLFGGSTTFEYNYNEKSYSLNEIIEDIEKNYNKYLEEDEEFEYRCYAD